MTEAGKFNGDYKCRLLCTHCKVGQGNNQGSCLHIVFEIIEWFVKVAAHLQFSSQKTNSPLGSLYARRRRLFPFTQNEINKIFNLLIIRRWDSLHFFQ